MALHVGSYMTPTDHTVQEFVLSVKHLRIQMLLKSMISNILMRIQIPARNSFLWAAATTKVPPEVTKASNPHPLDE